jgi:hypothetical protein
MTIVIISVYGRSHNKNNCLATDLTNVACVRFFKKAGSLIFLCDDVVIMTYTSSAIINNNECIVASSYNFKNITRRSRGGGKDLTIIARPHRCACLQSTEDFMIIIVILIIIPTFLYTLTINNKATILLLESCLLVNFILLD